MPKLIIATKKTASIKGNITFDGNTLSIMNQDGSVELPLTPQQKEIMSTAWQNLSFENQKPWTKDQYESNTI